MECKCSIWYNVGSQSVGRGSPVCRMII